MSFIKAYQLVGHGAVVVAGHAFADGALHETRERRQHVDRRENLTVVQLAIDVNLQIIG